MALFVKQYANLYIDDAAFGCPLRDFPRAGSKKVVDWTTVGPAVVAMLTAEAWDKKRAVPDIRSAS